MAICGIDYSTRAVDVVLLDEDSDAATWHRFELAGNDAFNRARDVRSAVRRWHGAWYGRQGGWAGIWDEVIAVGIEDPRGYNAGALYRVQGAILACLPSETLVHPLIPSQWRKTVGLPGNASKNTIAEFVFETIALDSGEPTPWDVADWPQDACDAYCIALATRSLLQHGERAA